ncbi:MAG: peptidylprolyl isomerase [Hyphomonadaceae bacterium]|nr:peptidylprolyl isomerase [Hyphomonadaceae bacterium]
MTSGRDILFLVAGIAGLGAAAIGAIGAPRMDALGLGAAAVVDGRPIPREAAARAVTALANDKRNAVTPSDEKAALERLIEEELLVQRGVALGLAETDLAARKAIVQSVLQLAVAERSDDAPDERTLRAFYADNAAMFAPAARVRARMVYIRRDADFADRVAAAEAALRRGGAVAGDPEALSLPATPLGPGELRTYLGGELAAVVSRARAGEVVRRDGPDGARLMRIEAVMPAAATRYEDVADAVRAEWDRRADEAAVRAYIERLKKRARISRAA